MIYSKENRWQAQHLLNRKVRCWSGLSKENIYEGFLAYIEELPYHFLIVDFYPVLKVSETVYERKKRSKACFEFVEEIESKDKNGNLTFSFY